MRFLSRLFWKSLPKQERKALLSLLPVVQRGPLDKILNGRWHFPDCYNKRRCIFVHLPKNAGNAVNQTLFNGFEPGHLPLSWYEQQCPQQFSEHYKFAFVRDPWNRVYSAWGYLRREQKLGTRDEPAHHLVHSYDDFNDFVLDWLSPDNAEKQILFVPQHRFTCNSLGQMALDFVGRVENMDQDFAHICQHLGAAAPALNKANAAGNAASNYHDKYSPEAFERVAQVYARDIQLFNYSA